MQDGFDFSPKQMIPRVFPHVIQPRSGQVQLISSRRFFLNWFQTVQISVQKSRVARDLRFREDRIALQIRQRVRGYRSLVQLRSVLYLLKNLHVRRDARVAG